LSRLFQNGGHLWVSAGQGRFELAEQFAAEDSGQHPHRKKVIGTGPDPAICARVQPSCGHDAMDVRMVQKGLSPGVKDRGQSDPGPQALGIESHLLERLGDRSEQQVDRRFGLSEEKSVQNVRHGKDQVKVLDGQEILLAGFDPPGLSQSAALGAVPVAAGVIRDLLMLTPIALADMSAQNGSPAVGDRPNHVWLPSAERTELAAVPAEQIG
jgi:hypothetical protein